jgi:hypothetical protein
MFRKTVASLLLALVAMLAVPHVAFATTSSPVVAVNATTLAANLARSGVSLAVLNTCKGAVARETDPLAGIAQKLIKTSVHAAIAMQFAVTDEAAIAFSSALYASLAKNVPLDLAVTNGRVNMVGLNSFEWVTPVLYVANADAVAFSLAAKPLRYKNKIPISRHANAAYRAHVSGVE